MVDSAYVHRDLGRHFRRHRGDLRHDRGCHLLAGTRDPPYRGTLGRAFRQLADRSWESTFFFSSFSAFFSWFICCCCSFCAWAFIFFCSSCTSFWRSSASFCRASTFFLSV